ncbi:MAG: hypothetical protein QGG71_06065 [Pirellulaceae bacterium]|nr:hypothetical protein [Pirellulaceae bacterium]
MHNSSPVSPEIISIRLDAGAPFGSAEQLLEFLAVPAEAPPGDPMVGGSSWDDLFDAIGLDAADFEPAPKDADPPMEP